MADKKGKGGAKKAPEKKAAPAEAEVEKKTEAKAEEHDDGHKHKKEEHGAHAKGDHAHGDHAHAPNIREYLIIFAVLAVLTVLEVGVAKIPGLSKKLLGVALVGLALTKAGIVGLYYMHLKHETKVLKLTVALPMAAPTIYALVLISEAAWRLTR